MSLLAAAPRRALILGAARSGKSSYAQKLAERTSNARIYLATGAASDAEMAARIARHRADRGAGWITIEEPLALAGALRENADQSRIVLVDCLTLWLSNLMFANRDIAKESAQLCDALTLARGPIVLVSNEVGAGIVPENQLARAFRDWQGRLNQDVARVCDVVVLIAAALPILLKPSSAPDIVLG
jgi:adenosylcobinamide kinase/adenosylcobinamide-phosphate guanylyltransferase